MGAGSSTSIEPGRSKRRAGTPAAASRRGGWVDRRAAPRPVVRPAAGIGSPGGPGRDPSRLLYDADFRALARRYPSFSYFPTVREAPPGWRGEKGELTDAVERLVHSVDRLVVYVCGGGETIHRVRDVLVRKGMDRRSVKWEKFW